MLLTDLNKLAVRLLRESGLSGQDIFPRDFHGRENLIKKETNIPKTNNSYDASNT